MKDAPHERPQTMKSSPFFTAMIFVASLQGCAHGSTGDTSMRDPNRPSATMEEHAIVRTSGHIGCPRSEIDITEYYRKDSWNDATWSWTATCRGRTFYCSDGAFDSVACTESLTPAPQGGSPSPRPAQTWE